MSDFDLGEVALQYAERGLAVFPCGVKKKTPACKHWKEDASKDPAALASLWAGNSFNIGLPTGAGNGIWALDIDGETGAQSLASLIAEHGDLPETPEQSTGTGRHIFFRHVEGIRPNASVIAPGLDIRGEGGYVVVAPSIHPSGIAYAWHETRRPSAMAFAEAPDWLVKLAIKEKPQAVTTAAPAAVTDGTERYVAAALIEESNRVSRAPEGQRNDTLNQAAFSLGTLVGAGALPEHLAVGNLKASAIAAGLDLVETEKTISSGIAAGRAQPRKMPEKKQRAPQKRERPALTVVASEGEPTGAGHNINPDDYQDEKWMRQILFNEDQEIEAKSFHNAILFLTNHKDVAGLYIYDEFADQVILTRLPKWEINHGVVWENRILEDTDSTSTAGWLERHGIKLKPGEVQKCIAVTAKQLRINPAQEYLGSLKWDGTKRLDSWLSYYLGSVDDAYTKLIGPKWLISAAARVFDPGCQVDTMLILEGPQGLRKSTALRVLATLGGHPYFTDTLRDIGDKDTIMEIQGVVIVEIAELAAMLKKQTEDVKAFLSRRIDKYRPPYGMNTVLRPRRCVFAGTVNPGAVSYLKDETGARRFWPVRVTSCDIAALTKDRDQLWAEAISRFRQGERYWLEDGEIALATAEQDERQEEEIWGEAINKSLDGCVSKSAALILTDIGVPQKDHNTPSFKRLAAYMHRIGWKKKRQRVGGSIHPVTVFIKEEGDEL